MKTFLEEIVNNMHQELIKAIFFVPILICLTIGCIKNYGAITDRASSKGRRLLGCKNMLFWILCGVTCSVLFSATILLACYFSFNLTDFKMGMYRIIVMESVLIGGTFNFKLIFDISRKIKLKGVRNMFVTTLVMIVVFFVCDQVFIH